MSKGQTNSKSFELPEELDNALYACFQSAGLARSMTYPYFRSVVVNSALGKATAGTHGYFMREGVIRVAAAKANCGETLDALEQRVAELQLLNIQGAIAATAWDRWEQGLERLIPLWSRSVFFSTYWDIVPDFLGRSAHWHRGRRAAGGVMMVIRIALLFFRCWFMWPQRGDRRTDVDEVRVQVATNVEVERHRSIELLREALRRVERHYIENGKPGHWRLFEARVMRPAFAGEDAPPLTALALRESFKSTADAAAAVQVVRQRLQVVL